MASQFLNEKEEERVNLLQEIKSNYPGSVDKKLLVTHVNCAQNVFFNALSQSFLGVKRFE